MVEEKESIVALATALAAVRSPDRPFGRVYEALDDAEQLLFSHKDVHGVQNAQFQQGLEEFVLLCNTAAIQQLQVAEKGSISLSRCGDLLTRAEQHTRRAGYLRSLRDQDHVSTRVQLRLLCLNNLACYNKQIEKPLAAIACLEEVLEIQLRQLSQRNKDDDDTAQDVDLQNNTADEGSPENAMALTHLNLCAVLSQMRRHDAAAEHARSAIELLQQEAQNDASVLLIAHYNLAVELEHLCDLPRAVTVIDKGLALARHHGLSSDGNEAVRLLEEMKRSTRNLKSPRIVSPRGRPPSPRTLRRQGRG